MPVAIGVVAVGFLAMLWIWANVPLLRRISESLGQGVIAAVPWLGDLISRTILVAGAAGLAWAEEAVTPLGQGFWAVSNTLRDLYNHLVWYSGSAAGAVWRIRNWTIPTVEAHAQQFANQARSDAFAEAARQESIAAGWATSLYFQAVTFINQLRSDAFAFAQLQEQIAAGWATHLFQQAADWITELRSDMVAGDRQTLAEAQAGIDAGVRTAEGYTDQLRADAAQAIQQAEAQARVAIGAAEQAAERYADLAVGTAAAAAAAALSQALARVKTIEDSNCYQECATVGGLGGELDVLSLGLLLAAVGIMAHDPKGAARVVTQDVLPGFKDAFDSLRQLLEAA